VTGLPVNFDRLECPLNQRNQTYNRIQAILLLRTIAFGLDQQDAVLGNTLTGQFDLAFLDLRQQGRRIAHIKAQLN